MQTHYKTPAVQKAFQVLEGLSDDDETRYHAQRREEALKFEAIALASAEKKGREEGLDLGELIGEIRLAQRLLKQPLNSKKELAQADREDLEKLFHTLEAQLAPLSKKHDNNNGRLNLNQGLK